MHLVLCGDGRSPHTYRWANGVVAHGHRVTVVWEPGQLGVETSEYDPSIDHVAFGLAARPGAAALRDARRARARARQLRPDVVHGLFLRVHGWTAAALGCRPLLLSALGSDVISLTAPAPTRLRARLVEEYHRRLTRAAVRASDVVLCDSAQLADRLHALVPGVETRIVRFGVDLADEARDGIAWRRRLAIAPDALVLLSTRLVRPLYNLDVALRALARLRDRVPEAVLVVKELEERSDPEYRARCLGMIEELGLADVVRLVGDLPREELLELYAAADVYLSLPSTDATSVSVLEAMAAGVSVVASDATGIDRDVLRDGENVLLVPVRDVEAVAAAVERLRDRDLRRRLGAAAVATVREHGDFERELGKALALYEELAG